MESNSVLNVSTSAGGQIAILLKQMAAVLKNLKTYDVRSPVLQKSLDTLGAEMSLLLQDIGSITLLVGESTLLFGDTPVYTCADKTESLAFTLYKDGIRLITFREGLSQQEISDFVSSVREANEADPYQSDLVTILWEKNLPNISYRAVDAYLDDNEQQEVRELAQRHIQAPATDVGAADRLSPEFFSQELGLSLHQEPVDAPQDLPAVSAAEVRDVIRDLLGENEEVLLKKCTDICLEVAECADSDDMFHGAVSFLGRICGMLAASGDFLSACSTLSELRALGEKQDLAAKRRDSIVDTLAELGDRQRVKEVAARLDGQGGSKDEIFAYLAMMAPCAVEPLCEMLAEAESRDVRYLLCRAISIIGRNEPDRLHHMINDRRWYVARNGAMILGMMGNAQVIPMLQISATHKDPRVRKEAARSVGRTGSTAGVDILRSLLRDPDSRVRLAAIHALRDLEGEVAAAIMGDIIQDKSFAKKSADERNAVMVAYGSLGRRSFGLLRAVVGGGLEYMDLETRASAVYGIAAAGGEESTALLTELAGGSEGAVRRAACEVLAMARQDTILGDTRSDSDESQSQ